MTQSKIIFEGYGPELRRIFAMLEDFLFEDGHPLAIMEKDEAQDIQEVSIYIQTEQCDDLLDQIKIRLGSDFFALVPIIEVLDDIDWVTESLKGLKPVHVGRFVVHGAHDRHVVKPGKIGIEIDAGQAFGTGHHGTTSGCIAAIANLGKSGARPQAVLDLGTGSAVLAIAFAKLFGTSVIASDIDPIAIDVAAVNTKLNKVDHLVTTLTATSFANPMLRDQAPYDLIIANILAGPLIRLAPQMRIFTSDKAHLILSGILVHQARRVEAAYIAQGFKRISAAHREEWTTLVLQKR